MSKYVLFSLLISCLSVNGLAQTISGNAFHKDNDLKSFPDAGATIYLLTPGCSKPVKSVRTDVNGNFKFDNLKTGNYLIAAVSADTKQTWQTGIRMLKYAPLKAYYGTDWKDVPAGLEDSMNLYKQKADSIDLLTTRKQKVADRWAEQKSEMMKRFFSYVDSIKSVFVPKLTCEGIEDMNSLINGVHSYFFQEVNLTDSDPAATVTIDFGIDSLD
ncbi:carboxypeptidase regulatory-like domain-containing protein [Taibaiella lutea]|uniref:Carboxypeptidase regulatory-like domain-containing protein n=1 Tax=Taibaiella lutea TaxID=2608001 RepID=A0A5M6CLR9_9BACT|nr:carboxypeptidase-like regulatory domain-containing protein [Taibaiella lutea]KAA5536171.1 carboxypeptidase regulatory-like domain-containing protein [Taibaiella lutea]